MNAFQHMQDSFLVDKLISRFEKEGGFFKLRLNESYEHHYNLTGNHRVEDGRYITSYNFSYPYTFKFEEEFDVKWYLRLMENYFWLSYVITAIYLIGIFSLQKIMANRPRYELRGPLFLWNAFLAIFSIMGSFRGIPETYHLVQHYGFTFTLCFTGKPIIENNVSGMWTWLFAVSKIVELGDTLFIVLRKQKLIFLHWYHHVTVLVYVWYSYFDYNPTGRWFIVMNYFVHSLMYSYYALKALKIKVPKSISMTITVSQIAQMVMGTAVNIWAYQLKQAGNQCHVSDENIQLSLMIYLSYFLLFMWFFIKAYMISPKPKKKWIDMSEEKWNNNNNTIQKGKLE